MRLLQCYGFSLNTLEPLQIDVLETAIRPSHPVSYAISKTFLRQLAHDSARDMIGCQYHASCADVKIKHYPSGAPYAMIDHQEVPLSISHLKTAIAVFFSRLPISIGVDLSSLTKMYPLALIERILTDAESEWFFDWHDSNIQRKFHFLWSLKEAAMKVWGVGMQIAPWEVNIQPTHGSYVANCLTHSDYPLVKASFQMLSSTLICSLAYTHDTPILHANRLTMRPHHLGC